MGIGDEVMALGEAQALHEWTGHPVVILDRHGKPRWSPVWDGCPEVAKKLTSKTSMIVNAGHCRPYIDYQASTPDRWRFLPYTPRPARLFLGVGVGRADGCDDTIILNPTLKANAPPAKRWPLEKWQLLADTLSSDFDVVQFDHGVDARARLDRVRTIKTPTFRDAWRHVMQSRVVVTHEGALHHAAAALARPAVVIFGGYISPDTTGYDSHVNLFSGDDRTIGWRRRNELCRLAMEMITVHEVAEHVRAAF